MWRGVPYASKGLAANLAVVFLAVNGATGAALILAYVLALVARHNAIGFGRALVLADFSFAAPEAGSFGASECTRPHTLTDAGLLVVLAGRNARSSCLGRGRVGRTK